jgi:hypothetical protein
MSMHEVLLSSRSPLLKHISFPSTWAHIAVEYTKHISALFTRAIVPEHITSPWAQALFRLFVMANNPT